MAQVKRETLSGRRRPHGIKNGSYRTWLQSQSRGYNPAFRKDRLTYRHTPFSNLCSGIGKSERKAISEMDPTKELSALLSQLGLLYRFNGINGGTNEKTK
jgi:hypothetical protein